VHELEAQPIDELGEGIAGAYAYSWSSSSGIVDLEPESSDNATMVTARAVGEAIVTVTAGDASDTIIVEVQP
jgi:hypothetical protein